MGGETDKIITHKINEEVKGWVVSNYLSFCFNDKYKEEI